MSKLEKQKQKLDERIEQLETELRTSLQKKAVGTAISVPKYTSQIRELKAQRAQLR